MLNCIIKVVFLLLVFMAVAQADHIAQGDFDGDGDVDFADFIVFANNFNKPIYDQTLVQHNPDTVVVRDTVTVSNPVPYSDEGMRAGRMLGFWYLNYEIRTVKGPLIIYEYDRVFFFNKISETPNADGEYTVHGRLFSTSSQTFVARVKRVSVTYDKSEGKYILTGIGAMDIPTRSTLYDLQCKFHFEDEIHEDMTLRINGTLDWSSLDKLPEPTAKIEHVRAVDKNGKVLSYNFVPVNDGLRRANRQEFMTKLSGKRTRRE